MPVVLVPTAYRGPTLGKAEISVEGETVISCLEAVDADFPGFLAQILDASGVVHRFVKLFVNGDSIDPAVLSLELAPGDQLEVIAAIAGG